MRARLSTAVSRSPNTSRTFPRRSPTTSLLSETSRLFLVNWNHASPYIALTGSSSTEVVSEVVPPLNESFASLYPICCELHSFLVPSFLKNQPRFLPILFLVEVISSATYFRHIILPSSSWGLKHQSKESQDLILLNTYLNIFFKIFRKTSTSVWTSSHFEILSNQPPFLPASEIFNFIYRKLVEQSLQNLLKPNIPFASSIFFQNLLEPQPKIFGNILSTSVPQG